MKKTFGVLFFIACFVAVIIGGTWLIVQIWKEFPREIGPHKPVSINGQFTANGEITLQSDCYYEITKNDSDKIIRPVIVDPEIGKTDATFEIKNVELSGTYNFDKSTGCDVNIFSEDTQEITAQIPLILIIIINLMILFAAFIFLYICSGIAVQIATNNQEKNK